MEDSSSGQFYYYNTTTQETSWDRPEAYVEEANVVEEVETTVEPEVSSSRQPTTITTTVEEEEEEIEALPADWTQEVDPDSGSIYYYNTVTQETSWDRPTKSDTMEETPEQTTKSENDDDEPENSVPLMEDQPEISGMEEEEGDEGNNVVDTAAVTAVTTTGLPDPWIEAVDEWKLLPGEGLQLEQKQYWCLQS